MTATIGKRLVEPPPEMLPILQRTAEYVASKGDSFEQKLIEDQRNNPNFEFLLPTSKYNSYYAYVLHQEVIKKGFILYGSSFTTFSFSYS